MRGLEATWDEWKVMENGLSCHASHNIRSCAHWIWEKCGPYINKGPKKIKQLKVRTATTPFKKGTRTKFIPASQIKNT